MGLERRWPQAAAATAAAAVLLLYFSASQCEATLVQARQGGSVELSCDLAPTKEVSTPKLFPLHVVEWVRLGFNIPILIKFGVYAPRVHPNYRGRVSLTRGASLLLDQLTQEDEGWFECRILVLATEKDDFQNGTWTFLSITAPPAFIKKPPSFVEVLLGDSLTLSCGAQGNPRPTVVWHKDDGQIVKHQKIKVINGTLSLASVTRNISGVYKCHVSNSEGNLTHSTQLQVKGPPLIIISPEDTSLNMSQDASLQCQADAYPSNLTYEWMKQGQNVYHIESLKSRVKVLVDGTLLIPNLIPEDAGNYTCVPTNGVLTPPSASASLTVKHPARVGRMPRETYLPAGMGGVIVCPVQADPPALYVNWTKDGNDLDPDNFPGWIINSEGSVFITTANDNAVGMYTCTAYNSYGTMGRSDPTQVILQDPPSFRVLPRPEYLQEVGRDLMIPCEGSGDPPPTITWSKIGSSPHSGYSVLPNGSLLLQPVGKDHHGGWECLATNRVATVGAGTVVTVLGTSPHAASSVLVTAEMNQANVSWRPGFDGGYTQKFTVWVKQASRGKHEWASLPVPTSKNHLLVTGLLAGTSYQFSVLPQNKLGSGAFSEIVSAQTRAVPTEAPAAATRLPAPEPPSSLSVNQTEGGVVLQWSPPAAPAFLPTDYVLQARRNQGQWVTLSSNISANKSQLLVPGLLRDCYYELRLMSRSNKLLSQPSESVNISTFGMEVYPLGSSFLEVVPPPLLAGLLAGSCFLAVGVVLSLVTACYMKHRRELRHRKRRQYLPPTLQTGASPVADSPPRSPDSVLKLKLCPPLPFFPASSSSQSYRSTFDKGSRGEYHDQRRQLLSNSSPPPHYTLFETHLGSQAASPVALESISRGPDGRFLVQLLEESSGSSRKEGVEPVTGGASGSGSHRTSYRESPRSSVFSPESEERKGSPLTLDVSELHRPPSSPGRVRAMASNFSRHGCFYSDDELGSAALLERASFYSDISEKKPGDPSRRGLGPGPAEDLLPGRSRRRKPLDRNAPRRPADSELTHNSTQISQLSSDPEGASRDTLGREAGGPRRGRTEPAGSPEREHVGSPGEPVWKPQQVTMRQKHTGHTSCVSDYRRACYFGTTSSPLDRPPRARIQWDLSPITGATSPVPVQSRQEGRVDPTEVSFSGEASRSAVTQNTSLPDATSESSAPLLDVQTASPGLRKDAELLLSEGTVPSSRHQRWDSATRSPAGERPGSSAASFSPPDRSAGTEPTPTRPPGPAGSSTLPYDQREVGARAKEFERERRSEKFPFASSPSPISSLTLVEELDPDLSQYSVPTMSGTFRAKPTGPSPKMSPQQTSAVLEYLSLPGFIEMSVDEPPEDAERSAASGGSGKPPRTKPDVVPKNWQEENRELHSKHPALFGQAAPAPHAASHKRSVPARVRFPEEPGPSPPGPGKTSKQLYGEKTQIQARKPPDRGEFRLGSRSAQTLLSAARGVADVVTKHSLGGLEGRESLLGRGHAPASPGSRVNNIASRICQAPVPFLKKSFSAGPCRALSAMAPPPPLPQEVLQLGLPEVGALREPQDVHLRQMPLGRISKSRFQELRFESLAVLLPQAGPLLEGLRPAQTPQYGEPREALPHVFAVPSQTDLGLPAAGTSRPPTTSRRVPRAPPVVPLIPGHV
ncbi:protein turtle homolog A [Takifugu rubripes]|uniref:protein turtle homolog A n=1 Tax=Takifugu rubripes TaxID=31033 RepID=UPI001145B329|nr:protein turtle homolog A-like [Takifugu rubripes]